MMRHSWLALGMLCLAFAPALGQEVDRPGVVDERRLLEEQGKQLAEQRQALEKQGRQIEELQQRLDAKPPGTANPAGPAGGQLDEAAVKKLVGQYMQDNPGTGMPPSVQTGYEAGKGFVIRSAPNAKYTNWNDEGKIPFELRVRGRLQLDYYHYDTEETINHLTGRPATANANTGRLADFNALEVKRANIIFEGSAFDPDLHFRLNLNGFTRGVQGFQNNKVLQTAPTGGTDPNTAPVSPIGGGVSVDHTVTLFEAYVWYDFHGCACQKGCGPDCPEGTAQYCPTYTLIAGKMKPFFGLEEYLGNQNLQFVELSMADLFFSADDDARLTAAGFQMRQLDDRFFWQGLITNGSEGAFVPATHLDQDLGIISGLWYDFGGTWNAERKAWDLYGDSISDVDWSCNPVLRVGGCVNLVPMGRRSLYGDAEEARYFVVPGALGGSRLINVLNGDLATPAGAHAVDKFDAYTYTAFASAHWHGWSLHNEWWLRNLDNFRTTANGGGAILYQDSLGAGGGSANALFPRGIGLIDFGSELSTGYFIIPKKLEVAARWSWVRGQSGDINGDGTFHTVAVPGAPAPVHVVDGAFRHYHEADEYTLGVNYFFRRQLLKWQTDVGYYNGGNPVGPAGQSLAGFISGADGWLVRTQIQLAF